MILTLTASIMYWSLQQPVEELETSSSPADAATTASTTSTTPDASPSASVNGEDESSLSGEISNLIIDDAASDTTVSSQVENEAPDTTTTVSSHIENDDTPIGDWSLNIKCFCANGATTFSTKWVISQSFRPYKPKQNHSDYRKVCSFSDNTYIHTLYNLLLYFPLPSLPLSPSFVGRLWSFACILCTIITLLMLNNMILQMEILNNGREERLFFFFFSSDDVCLVLELLNSKGHDLWE